jgi:hypothetical protein
LSGAEQDVTDSGSLYIKWVVGFTVRYPVVMHE